MSQRPSEPVLAWLRQTLKAKGLNVAALAEASGQKRADVRQVLAEQAPLTVDQLIQWCRVMDVKVEDFGALSARLPPELAEAAQAEEDAIAAQADEDAEEAYGDDGDDADDAPSPGLLSFPGAAARAVAPVPPPPREPDDPRYVIDPFGVQAEQIIRLAFGMGVNFRFVADTAQLKNSGVPADVLRRFPEAMPIQLDAAYHRYNKPEYHEHGVSLMLSFDTVRSCFFPWSAIRQLVLAVDAPEPVSPEDPTPGEPPSGRPALRLVK